MRNMRRSKRSILHSRNWQKVGVKYFRVSRSKLRVPLLTGWAMCGIKFSAWRPLISVDRPVCLNLESAVGWGIVIAIRIFLDLCTWCLRKPVSEYWILLRLRRVRGSVFINIRPLTKKGNDEIGGGFMDDHLWLILSTCAYIKENG